MKRRLAWFGPGGWHSRVVAQAAALIAFVSVEQLGATPPEYLSFGRQQQIDHNPNPQDLLRIWVVYIGQGDGIVIQLPPRVHGSLALQPPSEDLNEADPSDGDGTRTERIDILIDGGASTSVDAARFQQFVTSLYSSGEIRIEHAVITHHDNDHVQGFTQLLEDETIGVEHVYHNGLASFSAGARGLPSRGRPSPSGVYEFSPQDNKITRALGLLNQDGETFADRFIMDDLRELRASEANSELQGVYQRLAGAIVNKTAPFPVASFQRAHAGAPFLSDSGQFPANLTLDVLWPHPKLRKYEDWSQTINGNSVTFQLRFGDFSMLFTGDHNEKSEAALLAHLQSQGQLERLACDVLKVPHHGSGHALESFLRATHAVISVASQGETGAKSKAAHGNQAWQHPSTDVIRWLGGAHRVYLTQLHERRFDWRNIQSVAQNEELYEQKHILIETDGSWFRVVEVPLDWPDLNSPPSVLETTRSNGTRWIRAE
jgi:beta-lactamase superfamily II metal-dependent hydrolase